MVSDLGIVDWLALVVVAVFLAAAVAAAVIAVSAMRNRRRGERPDTARSSARHLPKTVVRSIPPKPHVIDLRKKIVDLRRKEAALEVDATAEARASRAEQLRNRPVPERGSSIVRAPAVAREASMAVDDGRRSTGFAPRAPGFFEDPIGRHEYRYWDGSKWTEHVKEHGQRFIDPL